MLLVNYFSFVLLLVSVNCDGSDSQEPWKLPDDLLIGASTAAYQIEGAWNKYGRGPSVWDDFTHRYPHKISDKSNGDVATNSYDLFEEDIRLLKRVGMQFYRFSISWSRIFPTGDRTTLNKDGVLYYHRLMDGLLDNGIEPMVTMYHWDMPQALTKFGGFTNGLIIEYFVAYADFLFSNFGNKVKYWFTFNEPMGFCSTGYGNATQPPLIQASGIGEYLCINNVLKAHGKTYRLYRRKYFEKQRGKIGITLNGIFAYPLNYGNSTIEMERAERAIQFMYGWLAHPIYKGDYPPVMRHRIDENSQQEGRWRSRLPKLSRKWINGINGTADFFSLNYYTSRLVSEAPPVEDAATLEPSWTNDLHLNFSVDAKWKQSHADWLYSAPSGMGDILRWIKKEYNNPPVLISENGWCDDGRLDDIDRVEYLRSHLIEVVKAIQNDGCNVKAYTVWSIIDNFEWLFGYAQKFGLHYVNFTSPGRERTPKLSAEFMKNVNLHRTIPLA